MNHFKSRMGVGPQSAAKRLRQATRVKAIYESLLSDGHPNVVVLGDLNDDPAAPALQPLLSTSLKDISTHSKFVPDAKVGTFGNGVPRDKIDYILLSPKLFAKVTSGGVNRTGVWGGKDGTMFPHLAEITKAGEAASDHAALFADVDI